MASSSSHIYLCDSIIYYGFKSLGCLDSHEGLFNAIQLIPIRALKALNETSKNHPSFICHLNLEVLEATGALH